MFRRTATASRARASAASRWPRPGRYIKGSNDRGPEERACTCRLFCRCRTKCWCNGGACTNRGTTNHGFNPGIDMAACRAGICPHAEPFARISFAAAIILLHLRTISVGNHLHGGRRVCGHAESRLIAGAGDRQDQQNGQEASVHGFLTYTLPGCGTITGAFTPQYGITRATVNGPAGSKRRPGKTSICPARPVFVSFGRLRLTCESLDDNSV